MKKKLHLLQVEDNEDDALLIQNELQRGGYEPVAERVETAEAMKAALKNYKWDIVISDYALPLFNGLDALEILKESGLDLPFILVSGTIGEDIAIEAMKSGASDYLVKENLKRLAPAVSRELEEAENRRERKRAEEALKASEEYARNIIESSLDMIIAVDQNRKITQFNKAAQETFGYRPEEVIGQFVDILYADVAQGLRIHEMTVVNGRCVEEILNRRKNGEVFPSLLSASILKDIRSQMIGVMGISRDITERKRAEEALRESKEKFKTLVEDITDIFYEVNVEGKITYGSPNLFTATGYAPQEILGKRYFRLIAPEDRRMVVDYYFTQVESGAIDAKCVFGAIRKDGTRIWAEQNTRIVRDPDGRVLKFRNVVRDITERKRTEEALELQQSYFQQLFENSPAGIVILDTSDLVLNANTAFEKMFHYSITETRGQKINDLIVPQSLLHEAEDLSEQAQRRNIVHIQTLRKRKDGSLINVSVTGYPIVIENEIVGIYGMYLDITVQKRLEDQLRQSQKLESLGTLAGGIAHDFNNILSIILGHTSLLERLQANPQKLSQSIEAITKATERGASLVRQLLTFARKTDALLESVQVNDIIGEIKKLLQDTFPKTITISMSLQPDLPAIVADASQIHQVLLNLCVNARDAMPKRGTLSISTGTIEGESVSSRFPKATARQYVQIEVSDTGTGMDETTRQRIFEPFFTTKGPGKGTGLGLSVVFGIAENHNGFIDVRSAPGEGTSFTVYLPIPQRAPAVSQRSRKSVEEIAGGTETILLIEDEEMLRELVKGFLVSKGYTVLIAEDGMQGVEMYQSHQDQIAIVLSDIGLPVLSGQDALRRIREMNPKAKVVLASGYVEPGLKSELFKAGAKDFIQKPYSADEVLQKIREVIDANQ